MPRNEPTYGSAKAASTHLGLADHGRTSSRPSSVTSRARRFRKPGQRSEPPRSEAALYPAPAEIPEPHPSDYTARRASAQPNANARDALWSQTLTALGRVPDVYRLSLLRRLSGTTDRPGVTEVPCSFSKAAGQSVAEGVLASRTSRVRVPPSPLVPPVGEENE